MIRDVFFWLAVVVFGLVILCVSTALVLAVLTALASFVEWAPSYPWQWSPASRLGAALLGAAATSGVIVVVAEAEALR